MGVFETGQVVTTNGIARAMMEDSKFLDGIRACLERHCSGDWGDVDDESREKNDEAVKAEKRGECTDSLFSLYRVCGREIYIITEIDRSATTVLFTDEY